MAKWFYYNESGDKIEVTGGQLKGLAKDGQITPETIIETEEGKTAPARRVKGLTFSETQQSETVQSVPPPLPSAAPNPVSAIPPVPVPVQVSSTYKNHADSAPAVGGCGCMMFFVFAIITSSLAHSSTHDPGPFFLCLLCTIAGLAMLMPPKTYVAVASNGLATII